MNIFAEITFADIKHWIPIITALLVVAFDWGILYSKIKTFTTEKDVENLINNKLKAPCPNTLPIRTIDLKVQALEKWKEEHTEWGTKSNEQNHLDLQELRYNLKSVCTALGVKYQEK